MWLYTTSSMVNPRMASIYSILRVGIELLGLIAKLRIKDENLMLFLTNGLICFSMCLFLCVQPIDAFLSPQTDTWPAADSGG